MDPQTYADRDRSYAVGERAFDLMRDFGPSATPQAYAVWYAYATGEMPPLNDAVKRLTARGGGLTVADLHALHAGHLDSAPPALTSGDICQTMLGGIASVIEILDLSLGSTARYGEALRALARDLTPGSVDGERLCEILATLVQMTREMAAENRTLESRMRDNRREIETLRESLEATRVVSLTDPLTGLANRKHFDEMMEASVAGAAAGAAPLSLIVLDVDRFKQFNDRYGHLTGDQVLRLVAQVMRESAGAHAMLSRFGGEEFAVILPGVARAAAHGLAERIRTSVMGRDLVKRSTGESLGKVTVSLGVALHRPGDTPASLLERADLCMFTAKRAGRNRTVDDGPEPARTAVA